MTGQLLQATSHRSSVAVDSRRRRAEVGERLRLSLGDRGGIEAIKASGGTYTVPDIAAFRAAIAARRINE